MAMHLVSIQRRRTTLQLQAAVTTPPGTRFGSGGSHFADQSAMTFVRIEAQHSQNNHINSPNPTSSPATMSAVAGPSTKPVTITYCAVCTLPTEYCEFGPSVSKCKAHLQETDKDEYERVWGDSELALLPR